MRKTDKTQESLEYYEYTVFEYKKGAHLVEVLIAIAALIIIMLWICWPLLPGMFLVKVLKSNGAGIWAHIVLIIGGIFVWLLNMFLLFNLIDSKPINIIGRVYDPFKKERYYLNVPKAYERVDITVLKNENMLDEWYHNGAFMVFKKDIDNNYLSYVYNLINDNYDLKGENLTLYKVPADIFQKHYTFHKLWNEDRLVIPASVFGITPKEHAKMRTDADNNGKRTMVLGFEDFSETVEGVSMYRRKSYGYRDEVKNFYSE